MYMYILFLCRPTCCVCCYYFYCLNKHVQYKFLVVLQNAMGLCTLRKIYRHENEQIMLINTHTQNRQVKNIFILDK